MSRTPVTIEDASIQHLDRLYEIEKECFREEAFTKQQISALLSDYNSVSLVAKESGRIVGFIIGMIEVGRDGLIGHVLTIDVSPTHRRKRIGLKLLQQVEGIFKQKNVKTCDLEVREDNLRALSLYEKTGYARIGKLSNYYGDAHGLRMQKILV